MSLISKKTSFFIFVLAFISSNLLSATPKQSFIGMENPDPGNVDDYWTPDRMARAKPFPMPSISSLHDKTTSPQNLLQQKMKTPIFGEGSPPIVNIKPDLRQLIKSSTLQKMVKNNPATTAFTFDRGSQAANFTSSRLIPLSADLSYPYSTVGKLFFTTPEGDFVCSASVLRPRVILTAGHCVHSGSGGQEGFFTNWKFIPAYRDGAAPYRTWDWSFVSVTRTWTDGGGVVPNAADYAMIESRDNIFDGTFRTLGSVVGWLGWQTQSLIPNHSHLLGYPCNLDNCEKMHQVTAQSAHAVSPNNADYGSDMRGGSSGGPWVQNFGEFAIGQPGGTNAGQNRIVGVTSYIYTDASIMKEGSSIFDARFIDLLNNICAHRSGNC